MPLEIVILAENFRSYGTTTKTVQRADARNRI